MNPAALGVEGSAESSVLYMALQLSNRTWKMVFGDGSRRRHATVEAGNLGQLGDALEKARGRFGLAQEVPVVSCYEAGRDGFWLHRYLKMKSDLPIPGVYPSPRQPTRGNATTPCEPTVTLYHRGALSTWPQG